MGKTVRFLPVILLTLVFLAIKPELVYAVNQSDFKITQVPNPVTMDSPDLISITVARRDGSDWFVEKDYSFAVWKGDTLNKSDSACTKTNFMGVSSEELTRDNTKQVTAKFHIYKSNCRSLGAVMHFKLWRGVGWDAIEQNSDNLIKETSFIVTQPGGQLVTMQAKSADVFIGESPTVVMFEVAPNKDYTFWWENELKDIAGYYLRDKTANPLEVKIPVFDTNKTPRKLCMEYDWLRFPPGGNNSCNTSGKNATFNFINKQRPAPTDSIKCTIIPSTRLPLKSNASIKIENVPSGTKVFAYAINNDTNNQWTTVYDTSDNTYAVTLTIVNQGDAGSYSATAYTDTAPEKNICSDLPNPAFIISSDPTVLTPSVVQCKDDNCSKAGGEQCIEDDPRGPGFKTAIGCIHTNPDELVKDLMTFLVGIGGGLAFLMMILGSFQMLTSAGNPETLNAGKSRLTSAVIGLLMIIFAVLLMQIIGLDILKIPGFDR